MSYREFFEWVWYLEWAESEAPATRIEFYLAQIAAYIDATHSGKSVAVSSKLMKFDLSDIAPDPTARIQNSKNYWMVLAKLGARPMPEAVKKKTRERAKAKKRGRRKRDR